MTDNKKSNSHFKTAKSFFGMAWIVIMVYYTYLSFTVEFYFGVILIPLIAMGMMYLMAGLIEKPNNERRY